MWDFGLNGDKNNIDEIVSEFRYQAEKLVAVGEWEELKKRFSCFTADARAQNPGNQSKAVTAMRETLQDILLEPLSKVKRDWFDDI